MLDRHSNLSGRPKGRGSENVNLKVAAEDPCLLRNLIANELACVSVPELPASCCSQALQPRSSRARGMASESPSISSKDACDSLSPPLSGYQHRGHHRVVNHHRSKQGRKSRKGLSDVDPCGSTKPPVFDAISECDGDVSDAPDYVSLSPRRGERRSTSKQARALTRRREHRRWSEGSQSTLRTRSSPPLGTASTGSSTMLARDMGSQGYYDRRSASQQSVSTPPSTSEGTTGTASLVLAVSGEQQQPAEPCSGAVSPLAKASALCTAYLQLLSRQ